MSLRANVASRKCCFAQMLLRSNVALRKCCFAQMLLCANVASRKCCFMQMSLCANVASHKCHFAQMSLRANVTQPPNNGFNPLVICLVISNIPPTSSNRFLSWTWSEPTAPLSTTLSRWMGGLTQRKPYGSMFRYQYQFVGTMSKVKCKRYYVLGTKY